MYFLMLYNSMIDSFYVRKSFTLLDTKLNCSAKLGFSVVYNFVEHCFQKCPISHWDIFNRRAKRSDETPKLDQKFWKNPKAQTFWAYSLFQIHQYAKFDTP